MGDDEAVRQFTAPQPTLLETLIRLGTPYLDNESANEEIIRLTVENIKLQAKLDEVLAFCGPESGYYPGSLSDPRD